MNPLRLVMLGTGDFAVPTFRALFDSPHQVVALVTQPDRVGRGHHQGHANAMKELALQRGTPVLQPEKVNTPESLQDLRRLQPDLFVVAAYGQILSPTLLAIPRLGSINVHASLLPRHRGAAPVVYAILRDDAETGVTIMQILPELDAGPILAVARTPIGPKETAGELEGRLAELAVPLLPGVLDQLAAGTARPISQNPGAVTRAPKLRKEMGLIDWGQSGRQIDCQVRALRPWPVAYTYLKSGGTPPQRLRVLAVRPCATADSTIGRLTPGAVVCADSAGWLVRSGDGAVEIVRLQPDGRRPMTAAEFLRGRTVSPGDCLADSDQADSPPA